MLLSGFKRSKKLGCAGSAAVVVDTSCIGHPAGGEADDDDEEATGGCRSGSEAALLLLLREGVEAVLPIMNAIYVLVDDGNEKVEMQVPSFKSSFFFSFRFARHQDATGGSLPHAYHYSSTTMTDKYRPLVLLQQFEDS